MSDLIDRIQQMNSQLEQALRTLRSNGIALAQAEKNYKEAVSKEAINVKKLQIRLVESQISREWGNS